MKLCEIQNILEAHPNTVLRFVLPNGEYIPAHAHVTEVGHVVRNFIDCGGLKGKEEEIVLQTHVGSDVDHRLRSDSFAKILQLGNSVVPKSDLEVAVEYDCCVVAEYPITEARPEGEHLNLILERGRTQCRARDRRKTQRTAGCCTTASTCC
jgi:hypothetical protein